MHYSLKDAPWSRARKWCGAGERGVQSIRTEEEEEDDCISSRGSGA